MKNLLNVGKALNKAEQKEVFGGKKGFFEPCEEVGGANGMSCNPNQQYSCPGSYSCVTDNYVHYYCSCDSFP